MSEWGEGLIRNKSSLVLWGTVTVIAILRYIYEARCAPQRFQEGPLDEEEAEAQLRNNAAEGRLLNKLEEATGPYKPIRKKQDVVVGDIEEVEESCQESDNGEIGAFSNACAICLDEFEEGDKVVRSVATKGCPHIFHDQCMKEVISTRTKKGKYSIPCPCCRQTFVETGSEASV